MLALPRPISVFSSRRVTNAVFGSAIKPFFFFIENYIVRYVASRFFFFINFSSFKRRKNNIVNLIRYVLKVLGIFIKLGE